MAINILPKIFKKPAVYKKKPFYRSLFFQVLFGIFLGIAFGHLSPEKAAGMKPLGDAFINLIKMLIAPIIFCTIVSGMAGMGDVKQAGRVGAKAILWFEIVTTIALVIGWIVVAMARPGDGMHISAGGVGTIDTSALEKTIGGKKLEGTAEFLLNIIPHTMVSAFTDGNLLQVLLIAILFSIGLTKLGEKGKLVHDIIDGMSHVLFKMVDLVTIFAPIGAFGAMAYTIGKFGVGSLQDLGKLILLFYGTGVLFVALILAPIMHFYCKLNIMQFLGYIRSEIMIVLGTSSSETVLPRMMEKLTALGCSKKVVGLTIPAGYSFNLDGSSLYFIMGALFITFATDTPITFEQQFYLLLVLLITSKGAAGVTGSAFLVLAATLSSMNVVTSENLTLGLALLFSIDRFMSTGRAIVNLIGNGIATLVIAKSENALDHKLATDILAGRIKADLTVLEK